MDFGVRGMDFGVRGLDFGVRGLDFGVGNPCFHPSVSNPVGHTNSF